jgi:hypothetical protein
MPYVGGWGTGPWGVGPWGTTGTVISYVGFTGVANLANTSTGTAISVVANAYSDFGDDVGDHGVVDLYTTYVPLPTDSFISMESTGYVLQESDSKIYLET